ncbi:dUTP diphosphatase [Enteractinococcus helveticum]|uniref:Deoxyuridine 5'-triphosphate nucleotidohydrolase n=1 Tax=Enteractinococcus helveticum TaxID=1837282 RepID=A0A1B7LZH2_9MICC|nr:dUTP diphosphatase [Enteractinococcus helveticum]OAV60883.1 deoxyuridine 5'-triphosphate nucleotidohydrolase [Enteractinococcus helveticum]
MPTSPSDHDRSPHQLNIELQLLDDGIAPPTYALPGDAGADLVTTIDVTLVPGQRQLVPTGVAVAIPNGFAGFVHPRSGLATRAGLSIVNAPGTIDAGYRGEIKVALINLDPNETIELKRGERIAQLVIQPVYQADFMIVDELPNSIRQDAGFGSTGGFSARQ